MGARLGCHHGRMRRSAFSALALVLVAAACSSSGSDKASTTSEPSTLAPTTTSVTVPPSTSTSTTAPVTTTTAACNDVGSTEPLVTSNKANTALLRAVAVTGARCADRVTFDFTTTANAPPKCSIFYDTPPFNADASGAPVTVSGSAFVRVRCEPAYGYDYANGGKATYTGPKQITATGTRHVRELVETGDFEGVLNWIIGLDSKRPFTAATAALSGPQARTRLAIRFF
jgi:hypothetical protein